MQPGLCSHAAPLYGHLLPTLLLSPLETPIQELVLNCMRMYMYYFIFDNADLQASTNTACNVCSA